MSNVSRPTVSAVATSSGRLLATAALLVAATSFLPSVSHAQVTPGHNWVASLHGSHQQLFDAAASSNGVPRAHMLNYHNTYNAAFNVPDADVDGVLTLYGYTTLHGVSDAMWAKYKLGEILGEQDATGAACTRNPWRDSPTVLGMSMPGASIKAMKRRGATFLLCNNALTFFSGVVAQARGLEADDVYADLKANILPEVTLVPARVIAIEQAHKAGLSYQKQ